MVERLLGLNKRVSGRTFEDCQIHAITVHNVYKSQQSTISKLMAVFLPNSSGSAQCDILFGSQILLVSMF